MRLITRLLLGAIAATAAALMFSAAPAHAEPVTQCFGDRVAVAGGATSCAFASNVRRAWFNQPGNPVLAYSPTTGQIYPMMCAYGFTLTFPNVDMVVHNATRCVDANGGDAIAYVW